MNLYEPGLTGAACVAIAEPLPSWRVPLQSGWKGRAPPILRVSSKSAFLSGLFGAGGPSAPLLPGLLALLFKYAYAQREKTQWLLPIYFSSAIGCSQSRMAM